MFAPHRVMRPVMIGSAVDLGRLWSRGLPLAGLVAMFLVCSGARPLAAEAAGPDVAGILELLRQARAWDWDNENSEEEWLVDDHVSDIARRLQGRPSDIVQGALRRALRDRDAVVRRAAVRIVFQLAGKLPNGIDLLTAALVDSNAKVSRDAAYALHVMNKDEVAVPVLIATLQDMDPLVRSSAAAGLEIAGRESAPARRALVRALGDHGPGVRRQAARSLYGAGPYEEAAVAALAAVLHDPDAGVREAAAYSLWSRGPGAAPAAAALTGALRDPVTEVRAHATMALGNLHGAAASAVPALLDRLADAGESGLVRRLAASALGDIGAEPDRVIPALMTALDDPIVSNNAAAALADLGPVAAPAVPRLIEMLAGDPNVDLRGMAGHALGGIGPDAAPAVPVLLEALANEEYNVSLGAIRGLLGVGPDAVASAVPVALAALDDESPARRANALVALREFKVSSPDVIAALIRIVEHSAESEDLRYGAIGALMELGEPARAAVPALRAVLEDEEGVLRDLARQALETLGE